MGRGNKKTKPHLEKVLSLVKNFDGVFTTDEVRRVLKECDFDEATAITTLSAMHEQSLERKSIEQIQLQSLQEEFSGLIDVGNIDLVWQNCDGDVDAARFLLSDMTLEVSSPPTCPAIDTTESDFSFQDDRANKSPDGVNSSPDLRVYVDHIRVVFAGRLDSDTAAQALSQCNNDLAAAIAVLSDIFGPPAHLFHTDGDMSVKSSSVGSGRKAIGHSEGCDESAQCDISMSERSPIGELAEADGLDSAVECLLMGILPRNQIPQFIRVNGIHDARNLSDERGKFILDQILLLVDACSMVDVSRDLLMDILAQKDQNNEGVNWLLHNVDSEEIWAIDSGGLLYCLLQPDEAGGELADDSPYTGSDSVVDMIRRALMQTVTSADFTEQSQQQRAALVMCESLPDDAILQCLDACEGDVDRAVAVLCGTLLNGEWTSGAERAKASWTPKNHTTTASTYASVLSDPHSRLNFPPADKTRVPQEQRKRAAPREQWRPQIVVDDIAGGAHTSTSSVEAESSSPQMAQQHAELEQYWRSVQSGESRQMQRGFTLASAASSSRAGRGSVARQLADAAYECRSKVHCASAEASKHALLARNSNIVVETVGGSVQFRGFSRLENSPTSRGSAGGGRNRVVRNVRIDMHGVDVRNALLFTGSLLDYCKKSTTGEGYEVRLIVGKGNHSVRGVPRLKPALKKFLQGRNIRLMTSIDSEVIFFM